MHLAGAERWAVIEDAARLRDALGVALPPGLPAAFTDPVPDPIGDLLVRYTDDGVFMTGDARKNFEGYIEL